MTALDRKLVRDVWQMRGQVLAICAVIGCGVATFVMMRSALASLWETRQVYYDRSQFAHVFGSLKRAPLPVASEIERIPGVTQVQTRIVREVTLDIPGFSEPAAGRLVSIPEREVPTLNALYLRAGRYIEPGRDNEVLASEGFTDAHGYIPGDKITAIINGRKKQLTIVGIALAPEYIYQIRPGEIIPDSLRYGIFWMGREALGTAFDMDGAFNDVALELAPATSTEAVIERLDEVLKRYGGVGAYDREQQVSHRFLSDEISQLRKMGTLVPAIFLLVAAFLLNVVLARIVSLQREQIAALKAFGYSNLAVGVHYLKLVLAIVLVGGTGGILVGRMMGQHMMGIYGKFYRFPEIQYLLPPDLIALAFLVSGFAAVVGTLGVIRAAVRLPPAEAMRPEPPGNFRPLLFERLGLAEFIAPAARMVLRHLERRPLKAAYSVFGIALAVAILVLGQFSLDAIDYLLEVQFDVVQKGDLNVAMVEPTSAGVIHEIERLPGVQMVEPYRTVPIRLRSGPRSKRTAIQGYIPNSRLYHLVDEDLKRVHLPPEGLLLNEKLARILDVKPGDMVQVEVLEMDRPIRTAPVVAVTSEMLGISAYMNIDALHRLLREGPSVSGAMVTADPAAQERLYRQLKATPRVASVTIKQSSIRSFRETIAENILTMRAFNVMFATIIAFGVVYNTARIALSERGRELASLRVLGFTRLEISMILLGELSVLTVLALPTGLAIGHFLAWGVCTTLETEMFRVPYRIAPHTDGFAVLVVVIAAILSGLVVRRKLDTLDLVAVLKLRE